MLLELGSVSHRILDSLFPSRCWGVTEFYNVHSGHVSSCLVVPFHLHMLYSLSPLSEIITCGRLEEVGLHVTRKE